MASCKKACTIATLAWSFLVFYGFWLGLVVGYSYFAWSGNSGLNSNQTHCFASGDKSDITAYLEKPGDKGHDVTANF